jgi:hypothetical protein
MTIMARLRQKNGSKVAYPSIQPKKAGFFWMFIITPQIPSGKRLYNELENHHAIFHG